MLVAILGIAIFIYPTAAAWISNVKHNTEVDGYVDSVDSLPTAESKKLLAAAREYNRELPAGPLRDPYALGENGQQTAVDGGSDLYFKTLSPPGSDTMARIRIPAIDVDLPVYHGTSEATLARGIGHLYGSSLPVGGVGTHSVLTGHSGFVKATLFDHIDSLKLTDTIVISVLGEDLYYEVDKIQTVLPNETDALRQVEGKDYLSLVTCTPTGVNTHRLLVRAKRVDAPAETKAGETVIADSSTAPPFPWWMLSLVGVPVVMYLLVRPKRITDGDDSEATTPPAEEATT
ncbi:class C sortase [Leucobacter sp. NPDC058333]|uniref:class C sortase n=1 Tax=Leucobacter sp. NPDC058333 TaxID=3346450 RepID=UPI003667B7C5